MSSLLLLLLTVAASPEPPVAPVSDPPAVEEQAPSEEIGDAHDGLKGLKMICYVWNSI